MQKAMHEVLKTIRGDVGHLRRRGIAAASPGHYRGNRTAPLPELASPNVYPGPFDTPSYDDRRGQEQLADALTN